MITSPETSLLSKYYPRWMTNWAQTDLDPHQHIATLLAHH